MGIFCSCSTQKPATTQGQDPTPSTADHVSAGSDDFGNSWFSRVSTSITSWMSQPSSSFTFIWDKNAPESSQFSDATGSGDGTLANGQNASNSSARVFTLAQLRAATYNFRSDMLLGKGGFGDVYKGWLKEKLPPSGIKKTVVAVKKLDTFSMQGLNEWKGYCSECGDRILVYEFMKKGSLNYHLFGKRSFPPLSWDIRLKIAVDPARGLAYLNTLEEPIIYRDFKSSNILLDEASFYEACTIGYIDPEYLATGHLHVKSDVYGFGVVMVEMLTGLRAIDMKRPSGKQILVDWAKPCLTSRSKLKNLMDSRLKGKFPPKEAYQIAHLAIKCLQHNPRFRPSMAEIAETLEQIDANHMRLAHKPATTQDQDPTPSTADHVSAGSDDFGNGWFSIASTSITTWMSHPSISFTTIWGKNVPESSQFSDATGSGDGTLANGQNATNSSVTVFTLAQLRAATYNFSSDMVLGKGGFGDVYKGWVKEKLPPRGIKKTAVAVKKLDSSSMQGLKEWKAEVYFLGTHSHPNLVKLLGYCSESGERILVYEFMKKGSLNYHLFGKRSNPPLSWDIRLKIAINTARGTMGYIDPEYLATGHLHVKSDVYGFGVVVVEMLTGLRAIDMKRPSGKQILVDWVKPYLTNRRKLKKIMDFRLRGKYPPKEASQIAHLAIKCLQQESRFRPSMTEIAETLEQIDAIHMRLG
ncbi:hypothetical protein POTOM_056542 [Populus tomentosa]|uniref:non-specific serine/threonine protein kinase n=1 Tax=Populus tomentosa TaxID=118781 RepID=A0A8X7XVF1_POPTO|nr:hypothetical protein POTOM_056542 [Populus tomentosa]